MKWLAALAVGLLILFYLRSPIDLIPDRIGLPGLLDDLIVLLAGIWWIRQRLGATRPPRRPFEQPAATHAAEWNPYAVLGVQRGASQEEIARAYREQMKRYHPDRVASLGEELQQVAHQKAVEIQRAYAELGKT